MIVVRIVLVLGVVQQILMSVVCVVVTTAHAVDAPMRRHAITTQLQSLTTALASSEVKV